jgi:hypothetical protein
MKSLTKTVLLIVALLATMTNLACRTGGSTPAAPTPDPADENPLLNSDISEEDGLIAASYHCTLDTETGTMEIGEPRNLQKAFNITNFMQPHSQTVWDGWIDGQNIWLFDFELTNPTQWTAYDVRVIMMFNMYVEDYLINPDGYTNHWNDISPDLVYPFIAYAKNDPDRAFGPNTTLVEQFQVQVITPPGGIIDFDLVVEVSFPGNCDDPYMIGGQQVSGPVGYFQPGTIMVEVYCHYGDPWYVWIETGEITGDRTYLEHLGGPFWTAVLNNTEGATPGTYRCKIIADAYYGPDQENYDCQLAEFIDIPVIW